RKADRRQDHTRGTERESTNVRSRPRGHYICRFALCPYCATWHPGPKHLLTPAWPTEQKAGSRRTSGMRPVGTAEELQRRRIRAVELVQQGESPEDVAHFLGCGRSSVYTWVKLARQAPETLAAKPHVGPKLRLSAEQLRELEAL